MDTDRVGRVGNLGRSDRALRVALALSVVLAVGYGLRHMSPEWAPLLLLHGFVTTAFLALTALGGFDPIYAALGLSTRRGLHDVVPRGQGVAPPGHRRRGRPRA